jgi:hypothetical protein
MAFTLQYSAIKYDSNFIGDTIMMKRLITLRTFFLYSIPLFVCLSGHSANAMSTLFTCEQEVLPAFHDQLQIDTVPFQIDKDGSTYYLHTPQTLGVKEEIRTVPSNAIINELPGGKGIKITLSEFNRFTRKSRKIDIQIQSNRARVVVEFDGLVFLNDSDKTALQQIMSEHGQSMTPADLDFASKTRFVCRDSSGHLFPAPFHIIPRPPLIPVIPRLPIAGHIH